MHFQGKCYFQSTEELEYGDSVKACENLGASLIMPKSAEEMDFLAEISFWYFS